MIKWHKIGMTWNEDVGCNWYEASKVKLVKSIVSSSAKQENLYNRCWIYIRIYWEFVVRQINIFFGNYSTVTDREIRKKQDHLISNFLFLVRFWMLSMLVTVNKLKHMTCHGSDTSQMTTCKTLITQTCFSGSYGKIS